jgi:hypothetical protein
MRMGLGEPRGGLLHIYCVVVFFKQGFFCIVATRRPLVFFRAGHPDLCTKAFVAETRKVDSMIIGTVEECQRGYEAAMSRI